MSIVLKYVRDGEVVKRGATDRSQLVPGTFKPDATTTGAIDTSLPSHNFGNDELVITTDGTILQNLEVWGDIRVRAANVVIRNCVLRGGSHIPNGNSGVVDCNSAQCFNLLVEDCTIAPQRPSYYRDGIVGHEYTARRCHVFNTNDGFGAFILSAVGTEANVTLEANYVHDLTYWYPEPAHSDGTHNDCVQIQGGANIHLIGNNLVGTTVLGAGSGPSPTKDPPLIWGGVSHINGSGTIIQKQSITAPLSNVVVEKNWYSNGLAGIQLQPGTYTVRDNVFSRIFYDYNADNLSFNASMYAIRGIDSTQTTVNGLYGSNVWEDTGSPLLSVEQGADRSEPKTSDLYPGIRWNNIPD